MAAFFAHTRIFGRTQAFAREKIGDLAQAARPCKLSLQGSIVRHYDHFDSEGSIGKYCTYNEQPATIGKAAPPPLGEPYLSPCFSLGK